MKIDLSGKTALVTGSTSGIGHAIARGLASAGADVVVNGRRRPRSTPPPRRSLAQCRARRCAALPPTFRRRTDATGWSADLPEVDILVNNAGIFEPKGFFDIPDEDWSRFFEVNVMSGVRLSRAYLPAMLKRNGAASSSSPRNRR